MGRRVIIVGFLFMVGALLLMFAAVSANGKGPWMYAFLTYFGLFAIFGNVYVLFGNRLGKHPIIDEKPDAYERFFLVFVKYGGALIFIGIALQLIFHSLVLGFGVGVGYWPQALPRYETAPDILLLAGLLSGFLLLLGGTLLLFRPATAIIPMFVGTVIFLLGAAYGDYVAGLEATASGIFGSYAIGVGLIGWVIITAAFRIRGTLR